MHWHNFCNKSFYSYFIQTGIESVLTSSVWHTHNTKCIITCCICV